jgi:hypothetical protein
MNPDELANISTLSGYSYVPSSISTEYTNWMLQNPELVKQHIEIILESQKIARNYKPKKLNITNTTKQTCFLFNLLETHKGEDISEKITIYIANGADVGLKMNHHSQVDKEFGEYEDFSETSKESIYGSFYPIPYAIRHHCHPNVIKILYDHTKSHEKAASLLADAKQDLITVFGPLYKIPYFKRRSELEGTYHYQLKQLCESYLLALELECSIFDTDFERPYTTADYAKTDISDEFVDRTI